MLSHLYAPFTPTFESLSEVTADDVIDANDLHVVSSRLRSECLLDSGDFGEASCSEDRGKPSLAQDGECGTMKRAHPRTR